MGVYVAKEDRVKRSRAKKGTSVKSALSKSAFVYKARHGGKNYSRTVKDRTFAKGASKEVMVKIVGKGKTQLGVKRGIDYISRDGDLPLMNEDGHVSDKNTDKDYLNATKTHMVKETDARRLHDKHGKANPAIVTNFSFSAPPMAKVKPEDAMNAVREVLHKKYPDNRFVLAYHTDKKEHPHVHANFRNENKYGDVVEFKPKDLRALRQEFCKELQAMGYDVKATHKQKIGLYKSLEDEHKNAPKRQKGVYEVVKFGYDHYQFKPENSFQNYITVKTLNKGIESTYWGKELGELCEREKVAQGDLIKLKKTSSVKVKVPEVDSNEKIIGWKETKRNQWELENLGVGGIDRTQPLKSNVDLTTPDQLFRLERKQADFRQKAVDMIKKENSISRGISIG